MAGALALVDVAVVDADRLDVDQHLPRPGLRVGDLTKLEDLGPAAALEHDRPHAYRLLAAVDGERFGA